VFFDRPGAKEAVSLRVPEDGVEGLPGFWGEGGQ
jgi:hypothetical protein